MELKAAAIKYLNNMSKSEQLANVNINDLAALLSIFQTKCLPCPSKQQTYRNEIYVVHMLVGQYNQN
jgi:hypothetical protein